MRMPVQLPVIVRNPHVGHMVAAINPSGCSVFKKIACGGALLACGAVCAASLGTACVECFAGLGASGCIDCL